MVRIATKSMVVMVIELLKSLALMGFMDIHVIDMDTIDISNLNRQFLFRCVVLFRFTIYIRKDDVGKSKAEIAAMRVMARVEGVRITPYVKRIQEFDDSFYRQFSVIISGMR